MYIHSANVCMQYAYTYMYKHCMYIYNYNSDGEFYIFNTNILIVACMFPYKVDICQSHAL